MGVVYRAMDSVLNRPVAIKVMSEGIAQNEGFRERFLREAQAAGSLQHPNVVTIYDFGETDGHLFIAMEFVDGADLEDLLRQKVPLTLAARLDITIDILNGLAYAHRRGIIHRDIKPANIRIDEDGHAKIMDFGVARLSTSDLTASGVMLGTPNYMAPEQITGGDVTPAVDLFAVGAILYELLTDAKPFAGDTIHRVLFKIVADTVPDLRTLKPDLPPALADIVATSLAKDPAHRHKNAVEMANALSAVRATIGTPRLSKTVSQRISIDNALQAQYEAQKRRATARRRRIIAGSSAGAVALVVLTIIGTRAIVRHEPERPAVLPTTQPAPPAQVLATPRPRVAVTDSAPARRSAPPPRPPALRQQLKVPAPTPAVAQRDTAPVIIPSASLPPISRADTTRAVPPVSAPPSAPAPTAAVENPRAAIASVISAYARAIGTRDVMQVRRIHTGMTPQQQSGWESFFASLRSMNASFDITSLDVNGGSAVAQLTGVYEYVTKSGHEQRQPISLEATLQRDGDRWVLQTLR